MINVSASSRENDGVMTLNLDLVLFGFNKHLFRDVPHDQRQSSNCDIVI